MELTLWFERNRACELVQVRFQRSQSSPRTSYRGKALAFERDAGLFQWSAAVKAFSILVVGTKAALPTKDVSQLYVLEGEGGSLAATLDYAIAKPTSWIVDLFGRESTGKSYARLVFKRENSERKRPGPVRILLTSQLYDPGALRVFLDGTEVVSKTELCNLLELLENPVEVKKNNSLREPVVPVFRTAWFKKTLEEEIRYDLQEVELLDSMGINDACDQRAGVDRNSRSAVMAIKEELLAKRVPAINLRSVKKSGKAKSEVLVASPPTAVGALAIFHHLRNSAHANVRVHASFPAARNIINSEDFSSYSAVVVSWAAAIQLYRREGFTRFRPTMFLPRTSFALILRNEISSSKEVQKVMLATEPDGYPMKFLAHAKSEGYLLEDVESVQATFSEIMSFLPKKGDAAIAGFPISYLLGKRHKARILWDREPGFRLGDNILFTNRSFEHLIDVQTISSAWYDLLENNAKFQDALNNIYSELDFINYLYRLVALYRVNTAPL
jgi:hypothetical protein